MKRILVRQFSLGFGPGSSTKNHIQANYCGMMYILSFDVDGGYLVNCERFASSDVLTNPWVKSCDFSGAKRG